MGFLYDAQLFTNRDRVRLLIGDTDEAEPLLQDEEILPLVPSGAVLALTDTKLIRAAYFCCRILVAKFSRKVSMSVGGASATLDAKARGYRDLAEDLLAQIGGAGAISTTVAPYAGGLSLAEKTTGAADTDLVQPLFRRDAFINKEGQ